jgi:hypothetical protein
MINKSERNGDGRNEFSVGPKFRSLKTDDESLLLDTRTRFSGLLRR